MSDKPEMSIVTQFLTLGTTMAGTVAAGGGSLVAAVWNSGKAWYII